ncbi:hypothetical protein SAMN05660649_01183 [Desulfotomaculum arcticum]|uniref:Uncharacterized protein n=1 Tax=Desulfotruncus arcticus DSM 17038 TaxID=1121424 RepID=A0A1I2QCT5_9FIRM|nr:hypothetical protein [Desulfotruncus arcticus]SFG26098.1 hypothetical protein SAMN05660649_01183 [Desulfotomaculum arcticum] [Desulfotruncus arcticus DSM 17038]
MNKKKSSSNQDIKKDSPGIVDSMENPSGTINASRIFRNFPPELLAENDEKQ